MANNKDYSRARATKKTTSIKTTELSKSSSTKALKTMKKHPILLVAVLFLIIGIAGGFFAYKSLSFFAMNSYSVNSVASSENDYIIVDMLEIKNAYLQAKPTAEMQEIYASVILEDKMVTCKFFGVDVSNTVTIKYYYREDISHDVKSVDDIDVSVAGVYYIEYTSSFFTFKNSKLIRTVVITEVENDG